MAILPERPGIKISIVCNGAPLEEYDDDDEEPQLNTVFKYVEAVSGAEFAIQWDISAPWPPASILFDYWLDQKKVGGRFCMQALCKPPTYTYCLKGATTAVNGLGFEHKFAFAALDVDSACAPPIQTQLMNDLRGMGEITVKAWFVKNVKEFVITDSGLGCHLKDVGKIPEKALKGRTLSHQTSFRAPQAKGNATPQANYELLDPSRQPFATYTFKYRSKDALKSLLVVPRSPSPVPLEEQDIETLSEEEMRQLLIRQRERDAAARAVKQERGVKREYARERSVTYTDDRDGDDDISVVSTKRRREHYRTVMNEDGIEAIDLT